ncbi:DUF1496 domain-containing protein [Photobacterium nomapromontoriensis]|uniref:DUF1496 domain-containing protein n=1 Tax=Photobacterium nomapromontoriensis TaxID=2910237 RepID=UPI003D0DF9F5
MNKRVMKQQMITALIAGVFSVLPITAVSAKETTVGYQPAITFDGNLNTERVCYFDGKAYSLGSVIAVEGILLTCQPEKSFETNGALKWEQMKAKPE